VTPRLRIFVLLCAVWILAISVRLYHLQVIRYEHYTGKAERQQQRVVVLDPPRGTIYDARGRELAVSVQVDSAFAVPPQIEDPLAAARAIAEVVPEVDVKKLARQLAQDRDFVWVARKLDAPVANALRGLEIPGIYFLPESKRYYPMRELAAQVLGYVGTDNQGLAGLEQKYDELVAGKPGVRTVLRDARRGTVVSPDLSFAEPEPGKDLHLTLDAAIQHIVERELAKAVEERGASRGSAVFLDPSTGAVLAMATYPSFDPNHFEDYPSSRRRNRAILDVYEPGSTFKVFTAAAALESGKVRPEDVFDCEMGGIVLLSRRIRDHKPFGRLTFAQVLEKSSNVGVIKAALLIGDEALYRTVTGFGFGRPTGIDLPGEQSGIVHPLRKWRPLDKAYVSFGQGISVTPLQLAAGVAAIANEGTLLRTHVVAATGRGADRQPLHAAPVVTGRPLRPQTARTLKAMMEGVVANGTGRNAMVAGYRMGGKTGTAQIPVAGGYSRSGYLPSFVGFAPVDRPRIVGLVAIAEPKGFAYHGGQVAAPVFGAVARQVLLYMGVRPERAPMLAWPGQTEIQPNPMVLASAPFTGSPVAPSLALGETFVDAVDEPVIEPLDEPVTQGTESVPASTGGGRI
jgi:cell division protein FtsI (penicillin-binding protein 3)